jgi:hypothetical protein
MRRFLVLALVLSLVLAGCGGAITTDKPTETTTGIPSESETPAAETTATPRTISTTTRQGQDDIGVRGGDLPVNPNRIFARVQSLLGTTVSGPDYIEIRLHDEMPRSLSEFPRFYRLLGIEFPEDRNATATGLTPNRNVVFLKQQLLSNRAETAFVLVHEYVHIIQFTTGAFRTLRKNLNISWPLTPDTRLVYRSIGEGAATYTARIYAKQYLNTSQIKLRANNLTQGYWSRSAEERYVHAPYYYGNRYAAARVDSPRALDKLYKRPPQTTETLIHRLPPGSEPPMNLSVSVEQANWFFLNLSSQGRMGELFVRIALSTELNRSAAIRGADGWGSDRQLTFVRNGQHGYAWVLRWDDAANATEFVNVFRTYLSKRAVYKNGVWRDDDTAFRVERIGERTIVVFLGPSSFVTTAEASGTGEGNVTIRA